MLATPSALRAKGEEREGCQWNADRVGGESLCWMEGGGAAQHGVGVGAHAGVAL
jgi:hypothetical protein